MNILFIVTESKSANGICCSAVMRHLVNEQNKVFCLTNAEYGGIAECEGVNYTEVKPRLTYRLFAKAKSACGAKGKSLYLLATLLNKLALIISIPMWPLISVGYCRRLYRSAYKLCVKEKVDCIIPIYTQIDTLIAARKVKRKMPRIKLIPYFLDSLSGGYGPKCFSNNWVIKRGIKWEDKLLPYADRIIMMQSSKMHYQKYASKKEYFKKIAFLDLPLYDPGEFPTKDTLFPKGKVNLLYVGSIPTHIRNPQYFFDVFKNIKLENVVLHIVGTCTDAKILNDAAKCDRRIKVIGSVEHDLALTMIGQADILVNFGNNNPSMTPCKIFEYMSLGKPIVSTMPINNEPSSAYLQKYPSALLLKEYENDIEADTQRLTDFIKSAQPISRSDLGKLNDIFYLNTAECFVSLVKSEIKGDRI